MQKDAFPSYIRPCANFIAARSSPSFDTFYRYSFWSAALTVLRKVAPLRSLTAFVSAAKGDPLKQLAAVAASARPRRATGVM
jgi:hypothetical protein